MRDLLIIILLVPGSLGKFRCDSHESDFHDDRGTCYQIEPPTTSYYGAVSKCNRKPGYRLATLTNLKIGEVRRLLYYFSPSDAFWSADENGSLLSCRLTHMLEPPPRRAYPCNNNLRISFYCSYEGAYFSEEKLTYKKAKNACRSLGLSMFAPETAREWNSAKHYIPQYWYSNNGSIHNIWIPLISKNKVLFWDRGELRRANAKEMAFKPDDPRDGILYASIQYNQYNNGVSYRVTFSDKTEKANYICGTLQSKAQLPATSLVTESERPHGAKSANKGRPKGTTAEYLDMDPSTQDPITGNTGDIPGIPRLKWEHIVLVVSILMFAAIISATVIVNRRKTLEIATKNSESCLESSASESSRPRQPFLERSLPGKTVSNKSYLDSGDIRTLPQKTASGSVHLYESVRSFGRAKAATKVNESGFPSGSPALTRQHVFDELGQYEIPFTFGVKGYVTVDTVQ